MKKQLLTTALVLTGIFAFAPTADAVSTMDKNLKMEWMNTGVIPLAADCRQGFGKDGKFYIQNKAKKKIEVWDQSGKIDEIASGGGTNITFDDAGNIIVRVGDFNTAYVDTRNEIKIIPADGSASVSIPLAGVSKGRLDFWGHVSGNVMDKTTGGILYMGTNWQPGLFEIPIIGGKQDTNNTYSYSYTSPLKVPGNFATTMLISGWDGVEDMALLSPFGGAPVAPTVTSNCNSIQKMALDADGNWVHDSFYITPRHNVCTGFFIFKVGTQKYIVYSSGGNNGDGFTVSKLATKANYDVEDSDESVRVATKYAETKDDGKIMYEKANQYFGNHLSAKAISDTEAEIYQYFPGGYIAKYKLTISGAGVENIEASKAKVIGGNGEISIDGDATSIEVYTTGGALISRNQANVKCAPGLYLVKADGNVTKVIVK
ncbi:MAG: hypothetical protein RR061_04200 [Muribaculaceae bacterium]